MESAIEVIASLEFHTRGMGIVAPACEVCGCTMSRREQRNWVIEGGPRGSWPRMYDACLDQVISMERRGREYTDVFAYTTGDENP